MKKKKSAIKLFIHCKKCMSEKPEDLSPSEYASTETGWTDKGVQIWCKRHDENIVHLDFMGQKVDYC